MTRSAWWTRSPRPTQGTGRTPPAGETGGARGTFWTRWLVALLAAYKRWLSPLLPRSCRFSPTCSEFAQLALLKYGFWRGSALGAGRILRCHPLHPGGIDLP
jgi:putative membrane protein insertion efficiency factor